MKLIVGLGNPGREYEASRHNTGFLTVDRVAEALDVKITRKAFSALIGKTTVRDEVIVLMKPQTYMNLSGEAVGRAVRYYRLDPAEDVLIIYDDMDLPAGKIRLREKGSSGGHNGIKSVISHLNTDVFNRIRIGIGLPKFDNTIDFVLGSFYGEEKELWLNSIEKAARAAVEFTRNPFQKVMNKYNR